MALDVSREEPMKNDREVSAEGIQLLTDDLIPAVANLVFNKPIEFPPNNGSTVISESIDIWQCIEVRVVKDGQDPVVCCIDAIEIPFGSAPHPILRGDHRQRTALGKRCCFQSETEAAEIPW